MKTVWLVLIDNPSNYDMKYRDRYRIFEDANEAIAYAKEYGYGNPLGVDDKIGMLNTDWKDVKISIMRTFLKEKGKPFPSLGSGR